MIEQTYKNKNFIICATGPGLTEEVIETIRPYKDDYIVLGINDSYRIIDFLDEHYACDAKWWNVWGQDVKKTRPGLSSWTQDKPSAVSLELKHTPGKHLDGFSIDPELIHFGSNSGYQALNLAFLMGGRSFILVGYNMQALQGTKHFFGDHPPGLNSNSPYPSFVKKFATIQPEIRALVTNCTPNTALTCFKKADLEETLRGS